jgi:hypothetical protein
MLSENKVDFVADPTQHCPKYIEMNTIAYNALVPDGVSAIFSKHLTVLIGPFTEKIFCQRTSLLTCNCISLP